MQGAATSNLAVPTSFSTMGSRDSRRATNYARTERFVSDLAAPLLEIVDPQAEESVLDLGYGSGAPSRGKCGSGRRPHLLWHRTALTRYSCNMVDTRPRILPLYGQS